MPEIVQSKLTARRPWIFESRTRLFLTLFLIVALPTAILSALTAYFVADELKQQTVMQNTVAARLAAKQIEEEFFGLRRYLESFANRRSVIEAIQTGDGAEFQEQLNEMVDQNRKISRAFLTDPQGILLSVFPMDPSIKGMDYSDQSWFQGVFRSDQPYVSGAFRRTNDQAIVVTIAARVKDTEGKTLGYLAGHYAIAELLHWFAGVHTSDSARIAIFDHYGKQVLGINTGTSGDISGHPVVQQLVSRPEGSLTIDDLDDFGRSILSHTPVPEVGWTVMAYQNDEVIFAPMYRLLRVILLFFLVALSALGLLGWLWQRVLFAYAEDLRRSNQELQTFCYSIAHDLRAPLRAMQGFTSIISEDYADKLDKEGRECARRVGESAARMDKLIIDLLEYGNIAHRSLDFQKVDLSESLEAVTSAMAPAIQQTDANIIVHHPLGTVSCDQKLLQRALEHLLSNALKYVAPNTKPRVEIRSEKTDRGVRLWFRDNGIGIAPEQRERIFGIFQRLHRGESYSGTGIGLAIVRKAAERMGGNFGVESEVGKGSAFWIELPTK